MNLTTAINHKGRMRSEVRSLIHHAEVCKLTSSEINERFLQIKGSVPKDAPAWLRSYIDGFYEALREHMIQTKIEFCYPIHGVLYSTNVDTSKPKTDRLYKKKLGSYLSKKKGHLYWKGTDKRFF